MPGVGVYSLPALSRQAENVEDPEGFVDASAGDYLEVPAFTVHRESNPTDEVSLAVIARAGTGAPTINVDLPPPPHR